MISGSSKRLVLPLRYVGLGFLVYLLVWLPHFLDVGLEHAMTYQGRSMNLKYEWAASAKLAQWRRHMIANGHSESNPFYKLLTAIHGYYYRRALAKIAPTDSERENFWFEYEFAPVEKLMDAEHVNVLMPKVLTSLAHLATQHSRTRYFEDVDRFADAAAYLLYFEKGYKFWNVEESEKIRARLAMLSNQMSLVAQLDTSHFYYAYVRINAGQSVVPVGLVKGVYWDYENYVRSSAFSCEVSVVSALPILDAKARQILAELSGHHVSLANTKLPEELSELVAHGRALASVAARCDSTHP